MDLMSFETPQQKQDREWDYWVKQQEYQNGNINSKDYQTRYKAALTSVQNLLSQYE
jgi:nicotinamide riboside kinase